MASANRHDPAASQGTLRGLDWLNFFLSDVQTGAGPFLAFYLASAGWNEQRVGLALSVGGIAGIFSQAPAGALVARPHSKRALVAAGILSLLRLPRSGGFLCLRVQDERAGGLNACRRDCTAGTAPLVPAPTMAIAQRLRRRGFQTFAGRRPD